MKDFILRNSERVFALLLTGIFQLSCILEIRKAYISGLKVGVKVVV